MPIINAYDNSQRLTVPYPILDEDENPILNNDGTFARVENIQFAIEDANVATCDADTGAICPQGFGETPVTISGTVNGKLFIAEDELGVTCLSSPIILADINTITDTHVLTDDYDQPDTAPVAEPEVESAPVEEAAPQA